MPDLNKGDSWLNTIRLVEVGDKNSGGQLGDLGEPHEDIAGRTNWLHRNNINIIRYEIGNVAITSGNVFTYYLPYDFEIELVTGQTADICPTSALVDIKLNERTIFESASNKLKIHKVPDQHFFKTDTSKPTARKNDKLQIITENILNNPKGVIIEIIGKKTFGTKSGTYIQRQPVETLFMEYIAPVLPTSGYILGSAGNIECILPAGFLIGSTSG